MIKYFYNLILKQIKIFIAKGDLYMAKKRIILDLTDEKDGVTGTGQYLNAIFPGKVLCGIAGYTKNIPFLVDCGSFQGLDNIDQLKDRKSTRLNSSHSY